MGRVQCVEIATGFGRMFKPIMETVGPFSIHLTQGAVAGCTVTHTASGYAIRQNLRREDAVRMAQELAAAADWNFTDPKTVKRWSAYRTDKVKRIVLAYQPYEQGLTTSATKDSARED